MDYVVLAGGLIVVLLGADWLVKGGSRLALRFRVPAAIIGLTLVAWGTSAPELVVSLFAALEAGTDMALGNVVGSCIANIGFVLGISALLSPLPPDPGVGKRDFLTALAVLIALPLMALDELFGFGRSEIGRIDGLILVLIGVGYHVLLIRETRRARAGSAPLRPDQMPNKPWPAYLFLALVGIAALAFGSNWFIDGAVAVARQFDVSDRIIGLTILALGTSMPELATSVVGSNIFNIVFALGVTAIVLPVPLEVRANSGGLWDIAVALLLTVALAPALWRSRGISRTYGGFLFAVYGGYLGWLILS